MKANASLSANRTIDRLDKEIEQMLEEAKAVDEEKDRRLGPTLAEAMNFPRTWKIREAALLDSKRPKPGSKPRPRRARGAGKEAQRP